MKKKIYDACVILLQNKIDFFNHTLNDLSEGTKNDSKSSAGDKHETAMAMMQIEQEKIGKQLNDVTHLLHLLYRIDINTSLEKIGKGSLIYSAKNIFFIATSLGKITVDGLEVFVISPESPLALAFMGKKVNDKATVNNQTYIVDKIN